MKASAAAPRAWTPAHTKILVFDIETSPNVAYVWRCLKDDIEPKQLIETSEILCWAAKWLGKSRIMFDSVQNDKNDKRVCETLRALFNDADIVVAHNGRAFDTKMMNTRWLAHGIQPPDPYKQVDTYIIAKTRFNFPRNKLENLALYLGLDGKVGHPGFDLWKGCLAGDKKSWETMKRYNIQDVVLLEQVYLALRAWDNRHPNVSLDYEDEDVIRCIVCGSSAVRCITKESRTAARKYDTYRCDTCGKVMRSRKSKPPRAKPQNSLAHSL